MSGIARAAHRHRPRRQQDRRSRAGGRREHAGRGPVRRAQGRLSGNRARHRLGRGGARASGRRAGQRRHRHAGLHIAGHGPGAERQLHLAQWHAARQGCRSADRAPRALRQRRQLLRPVGGGRRRGCGQAVGVRRDPRNGVRRRPRVRRQARRRTTGDRWGVGAQSAAEARARGIPRTAVLVRPSRLYGGLGVGDGARPGSSAHHAAWCFPAKRSPHGPPRGKRRHKPLSSGMPAGSPVASPMWSTSSIRT